MSAPNVHRVGGPYALLTGLGLFMFDKTRQRFRLESVHPGHTLEEIQDETGFEFDFATTVGETPAPDFSTLELIRGAIKREIAEIYPKFAAGLGGS